MEPGTATAAAAAAPEVTTILGLMLNTDQIIAAAHALISLVIGLGQIVAISVGIWLMVSTNKSRSADYDKRHQQTMDDQQKRHDEAMAAHQQAMAAHRQTMDDQKKRHEEAMADQKQRHEESMKAMDKRHEEAMAAHQASMAVHHQSMEALKELIRRTAPQGAGG